MPLGLSLVDPEVVAKLKNRSKSNVTRQYPTNRGRVTRPDEEQKKNSASHSPKTFKHSAFATMGKRKLAKDTEAGDVEMGNREEENTNSDSSSDSEASPILLEK